MAKVKEKCWALVDFRNSQRMTQEQFAEKVGVNRAYYSLIEQGKRKGTLAFWSKLQAAFNIPDDKMWELTKTDENKQ